MQQSIRRSREDVLAAMQDFTRSRVDSEAHVGMTEQKRQTMQAGLVGSRSTEISSPATSIRNESRHYMDGQQTGSKFPTCVLV